jgi:hypothetical protein
MSSRTVSTTAVIIRYPEIIKNMHSQIRKRARHIRVVSQLCPVARATTREIETALRPSSDGIRLDGIALDEICCDGIRFIAAKHTSTVSRSSVTRNHEPQSFLGRIPNPEPPCSQFSPSEPRHSSLSNSFRTSAMACQESVVIFLERHRPTTAWPTRSAQ